jgi:hypothetical protein
MRKPYLLFIFIVLVIGLGGCGGSEDETTAEGDTAAVSEAIEGFATNADPTACQDVATEHFLRQTEFSSIHEAVERCQEEAHQKFDDPSSIDVLQVEVDGSSATADVAFEGGSYDGQTLSVELVKEGGRWKMDSLTGFAEFDKDKLMTAFEEGLKRVGGARAEPLVRCYGDAIRALPDDEAEEVMLSGSQKQLLALWRHCTAGAVQ